MIDQSEANTLSLLFDKYVGGGGINLFLNLKANRAQLSDIQVSWLYKSVNRVY